MIPYGRQTISEDDIQAVAKVLRSDWLTQGPSVEQFEDAIAARCGATYAVAVSSGTAALHVAALATGLGPGRRLWTTPNTFVASANCALYCGASVDFVDVDARDGNISIAALTQKLEEAEANNQLPDVLIPVDFAGKPCDYHAINALKEKYGFVVIEDASHALGAEHQGNKIGCGRFADITVLSFHPVKIVTTGEGGMLLTNSAEFAERMRRFRTSGITRDGALAGKDAKGGWDYFQIDLGFNYRLSDIHAALGLSQLTRLNHFVEKRNDIADRYDRAFTDLPVRPMNRREGDLCAYHLYVIRVAAHRRKALYDHLHAMDIRAQVHYIPVHTQPYFENLGFQWGDFPEAENHYHEALSLPMYPAMTDGELDQVISEITQFDFSR